MANRGKAIEILQKEFPNAEVGLDNSRPYAKLPNGQCFGILFRVEEGIATEPEYIIEFTTGYISNHNYRIYKVLAE